MIAAIYARKSTDQNGVADEAKSVTRQIEHARAYAEQKGWTVAEEHIYADDGISGAEFEHRPGLQRLLSTLQPRPPFGALVVAEESRLGRETLETGYLLKRLLSSGVRIFSYLDNRELRLDSATDKMVAVVKNVAADLERDHARARTYDALVRKARAGFVAGGSVYGYVNVRTPEGVKREIHPAEADVIRKIFHRYAEGAGLRTIARELNALGLPAS